jgi:hypothetical protein
MCNSLKSKQKNEHVVLRVLPMTGLFGTEPRAESSYSINGDIRELATKAAEFPSQQEV